MLKIVNLFKKYNEKLILENVDINITSPGIYVICGESGCGKSTLINILGLMENEYDGDYFFFDRNVKNISEKEKELIRYNQISYIYQNPKFLENESIKVNLEIALNKHFKKKELNEELKKMNLHVDFNKKISLLSGGERKRLGILISLLKDTPLILGDEITVGLDEENKKTVISYLVSKSENKIILLVTHDISFIKKITKNIYYIKDKKIQINSKEDIVYEKEAKRDNKLNNKFIRKHVTNHIKNKTVRTLASIFSMVIALVSFGFSILLTSSLSDAILNSLTSNINDHQIIMSKKEESKMILKNTTLNKDEIKIIKKEYNHYFSYEGVNYLNDLSLFFKDEDYFELIINNRKIILKDYDANDIKNFSYVELDNEEYIYSSKKILQEDEIIIGLTNNQIYTFCNLLNIEYKDETSLMNYLSNQPLELLLHFSNNDWDYQIDVNLKIVGYFLNKEAKIYHTSSLWNEYFLEEVLQLIYSYELDVVDEIPWTMKKIHYFKIKKDKEFIFLNLFLSNINLEKYIFSTFKKDNGFGVCFIKRHDNNFTKTELDNMLNENLIDYTPCSTNGYSVFSNALLKGFVKPTLITNEYKLIEEYIDYNSYSSSNLGNFQSTILTSTNENLLSLNILDSSKDNYILLKTYRDEKDKIIGEYPKKYNDIIVSKGLLKDLNFNINNGVFSEKQIFLLTLKDVEYANGKYKNNYVIEKLNICGVIESEEKFLYTPTYWPNIFLSLILEESLNNYPTTDVIFSYEGEDIENYIDFLNSAYPKYHFENSFLDYKKKVDETIYYLNIGLNIFSIFCLTSSLLMIFISSYLFVMDSKREIGIYTFYGYQRKSIEKQFKNFGRYLSFYASIISCFCLLIIMFVLNEGIIGIKLPFTLESTFPFLLMVIISLIIGDISSFLSCKKTLKESPLKQLQEN